MKRKDWILFVSVIVFSLLTILFMKGMENHQGDCVVIRQNGEIYGTYRLDEEQVVEIEEGEFYNRICIRNRKVYMEEANCPDGYCVSQNEISGEKQTIVCLPHKLVVEIIQTDEKNEEPIDAVTN